MLQSMGSQRVGYNWTTEQQQKLQGIVLTWESNWNLQNILHWQADFLNTVPPFNKMP